MIDYQQVWDWQKELQKERFRKNIPDVLMTLSHPKVYGQFSSKLVDELWVSTLFLTIDTRSEEEATSRIFCSIKRILSTNYTKLKEEVKYGF